MVWRGVAMQGNAGEDGYGMSMRGWARQARQAWMGAAGYVMVWRGAAGMSRRGKMTTGKDPWQPGKTGYILITPKGTKGRARNEKQKQNQARK